MKSFMTDILTRLKAGALKMVEAGFSYKYHVFLAATVALFLRVIDGWQWLGAVSLFTYMRQKQHNWENAWRRAQRKGELHE